MLKKINISQLRIDMFVAEIMTGTASNMPKKKRGMIRDARVIDKFREIGIESLVIDTSKGLDVTDAETVPPAKESPSPQKIQLAGGLAKLRANRSTDFQDLKQEWQAANDIFDTSVEILNRSIDFLRGGGAITPEIFEDASRAISRSVLRNKDALTWLGKVRNTNSYIYEHSVNTAVLMGIFCHSRGFAIDETEQCITGALLHDLGQIGAHEALYDTPGPLTETQFEKIKMHVDSGAQYLPEEAAESEIIRAIVTEHHERIDGSGYPLGLEGHALSVYGKMFAIVDVYDALTNNRAHKKGIPSSHAMKTLLEEAGKTLDQNLVHQFIKCLGVYSTGSLIKLSNDTLAVVIAQNPDAPMQPLVKLIYNTASSKFLVPKMLNLFTCREDIKVKSYEDPRKFKIKIEEFMPQEFEL